jgi:hypothetical protein
MILAGNHAQLLALMLQLNRACCNLISLPGHVLVSSQYAHRYELLQVSS